MNRRNISRKFWVLTLSLCLDMIAYPTLSAQTADTSRGAAREAASTSQGQPAAAKTIVGDFRNCTFPPCPPPTGMAMFHCATMDSSCEAALMDKLKSNPLYAKDTRTIITEAKSDYTKVRSTHLETARRTGNGTQPPGSVSVAYWYCHYGPFFDWCIGDDGVDFFYRQSQAPTEMNVTVDCRVFDSDCLGRIRVALSKTKYANRTDFILSEVKKGYAQGANARLAKRTGFDYTFHDPTLPAQLTHHIHFSWGEVIGIAIGLML